MRTTHFGAFALAGPTAPALERMAWAAGRAREVLADPRRLLEVDLLGNLASRHQASFRLEPEGSVRLVADPPAIANYAGRGLNVKLPPAPGLLCHWMFGGKAAWFDLYGRRPPAGSRLSPWVCCGVVPAAARGWVLR